MKKYLPYVAAVIVGLAGLLPACGSSSSEKRKPAKQVAGLRNIRSSIDELLNSASPQNPIEIIISDAVINDPTVRFTEGQAALDIGYRLQGELQRKYNSAAVMVTGRFVSNVESDPYEKNRVFVGTPANNKIIGDAIASLPDAQDQVLPQAGTGRVYGITAKNGNFLIVVTGADSFDVMRTGYALSEYDKYPSGYLMDFNGQIVDVASANSPTTIVK